MKSISSALDMKPLAVAAKEQDVQVYPTSYNSETEIQDDFEYARNNLKTIIDKGQTALDGILTIANGSEHPRAYEVAAALIKTMAETNKDLLELQKTKKVLQQENDTPQNVTNNLYVGTTAELQKLISDKKDD